ncbi:MAG: hypothetical protein AAFV47_13595 [Pseudomonadota bacterium]
MRRFVLLLFLLLAATACGGEPESDSSIEAQAASIEACTAALQTLRGELFGALRGALSARAEPAICAGSRRPKGGVRLRYRSEANESLPETLIILGIDSVEPGKTATALRTTVTMIDETNQRFFSTADQAHCFADITDHEVLHENVRSVVTGVLWCTAAIAAVSGEGSVRVRDLEFQSVIDWKGS